MIELKTGDVITVMHTERETKFKGYEDKEYIGEAIFEAEVTRAYDIFVILTQLHKPVGERMMFLAERELIHEMDGKLYANMDMIVVKNRTKPNA